MSDLTAAAVEALLDAPDALAVRVRELVGTSVALVAIAATPRSWCCSLSGMEESEAGTTSALALQTLLRAALWRVDDCLEDPLVGHHPAVVGAPWVRRLLAVPLHASDGRVLGCLCALDFEPAPFAATAVSALGALAASLALALERRDLGRSLHRVERRHREAPETETDPLPLPAAPRDLPRLVCLHGIRALFQLHAAAGLALLRLECREVDRYVASVGMEGLADLLEIVAARIGAELPPQASFCRFGDEEFLIVVPQLPDAVALADLAERLARNVATPCRIGGHTLPVLVAVGATLLDGSEVSLGSVLSEVAVARRLACGPGGGFRLVDAGMRRQVRDDFTRESRFRDGLAQGEVVPFFQPIVDLGSGRPRGFEALARWQVEGGSVQVPADFLTVAQQIGLTGELDLAVIRQVLAVLPVMAAATPGSAAAPVAGEGPLVMSVNLSAQLLERPALCESLLAMIEASPPPPGWRLQVEILEEALQLSDRRFDAFLSRLAALQVGIAIDDFGTGYSSLARLHNLPIHAFKIDRSFVERIDDRVAPSNQLLRTMNTLAIDLGLTATAEGVGSQGQCDWLRRSGFLSGQGFLFSRPLSLEHTLLYLREQLPASLAQAEEPALSAPRGRRRWPWLWPGRR